MKRANDFAVGLTILVAIGVITASIFWIKQSDIGQRRSRFVARFRDVGSAGPGTPVVIRGVRSGRIEAMELAPGGWVEVRMNLDAAVILPAHPVVLLNESSLFGEWQATVLGRDGVPRDADVARQLTEADRGDAILPGATLPDIAKLTAVAGRIAGDVASVAERFEVAFDDRAAAELRGSIRNVSELSAVLARTVRDQSQHLDSVSGDVRVGVQSLARAADLLHSVASRVDSSTARGEVDKVVSDAGEAARQLRQASKNLLTISEQLGRSQDRLQSFLATSDSVATKINRGRGSLGMLVNDSSLYRHSDSLLIEFRSFLADLQRNPKKYVQVRIF
jgi:phospholipid/cholesterol/gamma-HCH transport system substrate-binding protein